MCKRWKWCTRRHCRRRRHDFIHLRARLPANNIPLHDAGCLSSYYAASIRMDRDPPRGGVLPGGVKGKQYRTHIHTAKRPIDDWRATRGCRELPIQIEINAREAYKDGVPVFEAADGCVMFLNRIDPWYIKRIKVRNSECPIYKHDRHVDDPLYEETCTCGRRWPSGMLICPIITCMRAITKEGIQYELNNLPISKPQKAALLWYRYNLRVQDIYPDMTAKAARQWFIDDNAYNAYHAVYRSDPARAIGVS